jgi:hypothetical protein
VPLPNPDNALVGVKKIRDYLLSSTHPIGRFKAAFFAALVLELARVGVVTPGMPGAFGRKLEVSGRLVGPNGRSAFITTVWIVRTGEDFARFVTAFPS